MRVDKYVEMCLAIERGIEQWIRGGEDVSD